MIETEIPLLGFAARSGTGKTALLRALIPLLRDAGVRVGVVKHTHHDFEIDKPGKDSYELRKAGACETILASGNRWALISEREAAGDPDLLEVVDRLDQSRLDLILVEGFKHELIPKVELYRSALDADYLYPDDPLIIALAADTVPRGGRANALLDINNVGEIAAFVLSWIGKDSSSLEE